MQKLPACAWQTRLISEEYVRVQRRQSNIAVTQTVARAHVSTLPEMAYVTTLQILKLMFAFLDGNSPNNSRAFQTFIDTKIMISTSRYQMPCCLHGLSMHHVRPSVVQ